MNRSPCGPRPGEDSPARRGRGCRPSPAPAACAPGRAGPGRPEPRRTCRGSLARRIPSAWLLALSAGGAQRRTPRYRLQPRTSTGTGQRIDEQLQGQPLPAGIENPLVPGPTTAEPEIQTPASSGDRATAVLQAPPGSSRRLSSSPDTARLGLYRGAVLHLKSSGGNVSITTA